ncbi:hypothetical protein LIER_33369 [Lithospermum erythrorhizon]|uniref:Reverse transcriptase Ty1/copia-type domain-containing protein n=1 Tax=Lithospermum erythrorhizon TaxID=34254 RepID=A0AAV3RWF5_LITER
MESYNIMVHDHEAPIELKDNEGNVDFYSGVSTKVTPNDSPIATDNLIKRDISKAPKEHEPSSRVQKTHPTSQVIGSLEQGVITRSKQPEKYGEMIGLKKALYSLKEAPRAWYERLTKFLTQNGYVRAVVDDTLFVKTEQSSFIAAQVYVDDIIFGWLSDQMATMMQSGQGMLMIRRAHLEVAFLENQLVVLVQQEIK